MRHLFSVRISSSLVVMLLAILNSSVSIAAEWGSSISQSVTFDDNAHDVKHGKESETNLQTTFAATLRENTKSLDLALNYTFSHNRYQQQHFDNTNTATGSGRATWNILPGRINWFVADNESYSIIDRSLADSPDNRAQQSSFSTGPSITFPLSPVDTASLNATYSRSTTDADNKSRSEVNSGSFAWSHQLSVTKSFSVSLSKSTTEFGDGVDEEGNEYDELESSGASTSFNMLLPSGSVSLAVGADKLERGSGSSTTSSSFQFSYSTAWSNSSLSLSATKELTDTVGRYDDPFFDEFRSLAVSGGFDVTNLETEEVTRIDSEEKFDALGFADSSFDIEDAVIRTTASTNYSTSLWSPLNQLVVGAAYTEDILQTLKDKQRVKSADIHLSRQTSENHTLYTRYNFQWTHFDSVSINRKDIFHSLSIGSDYELGQSLTLSGNLSGSLRRVGSDDGIISKALSISIAYEIH